MEGEQTLSRAQPQQEQRELRDKLLSTVTMKSAFATITLLVLALGWTSEAVQVEVSASPSISVAGLDNTH